MSSTEAMTFVDELYTTEEADAFIDVDPKDIVEAVLLYRAYTAIIRPLQG
jgi:hypothetical protein